MMLGYWIIYHIFMIIYRTKMQYVCVLFNSMQNKVDYAFFGGRRSVANGGHRILSCRASFKNICLLCCHISNSKNKSYTKR